MSLDLELETWRREWQSEAAVLPDLRRRVERQSRWMRIAVAGDILVTVVIGGGAIAMAVASPKPQMMLLVAATWLFIAAAWVFRLLTNRGLWSPSAMGTADFVDLMIGRCRARLAGVTFGALLYVCEIAFCVGWLYRYSSPSPSLAIWIGSVTLAFFAFLAWYRRKQRAELAWLLGLR
jgi:hypothetical protein